MLIAVGLAIVLGYVRPDLGVAMRPLGDAFIRLISMIITLVIFCTIVTGIAGMGDMKKVGRVGGKALLYFKIVSNFALLIGLLANRARRDTLRQCRDLLGQLPSIDVIPDSVPVLLRRWTGVDLSRCPVCGEGHMQITRVVGLGTPPLDTS